MAADFVETELGLLPRPDYAPAEDTGDLLLEREVAKMIWQGSIDYEATARRIIAFVRENSGPDHSASS